MFGLGKVEMSSAVAERLRSVAKRKVARGTMADELCDRLVAVRVVDA
jgi:hypothetical protein